VVVEWEVLLTQMLLPQETIPLMPIHNSQLLKLLVAVEEAVVLLTMDQVPVVVVQVELQA
jgi:hypothetical protein